MFVCPRILSIAPVSQIKSNLKVIGHADFDFVPEVQTVKVSLRTRTCAPGDPVLRFHATGRRRRRFVNIREATRPRLSVADCGEMNRGQTGRGERYRCDPEHLLTLAARSPIRCRTVANF